MRNWLAALADRLLMLAVLVDFHILINVERRSWFVQRLTGYDCFSQGRACTIVAGGVATWAQAEKSVLWAVVTGMSFFLQVLFHDGYERLYREDQLINLRKLHSGFMVVRLGWLAITVALAGIWSNSATAVWVFLLLRWYLEACNPLPPGAGKIRGWLRKLKPPAYTLIQEPA